MGRIRLKTLEETLEFGKKMALKLPPNSVLALTGDLGAGKTSFVQGLALGLGILEPIQSPTFVLLNSYPGLHHFDLYRLKAPEEFIALGFDEYFEKEGLTAIEWPSRIDGLLPQGTIYINFSYDGNERIAEVTR